MNRQLYTNGFPISEKSPRGLEIVFRFFKSTHQPPFQPFLNQANSSETSTSKPFQTFNEKSYPKPNKHSAQEKLPLASNCPHQKVCNHLDIVLKYSPATFSTLFNSSELFQTSTSKPLKSFNEKSYPKPNKHSAQIVLKYSPATFSTLFNSSELFQTSTSKPLKSFNEKSYPKPNKHSAQEKLPLASNCHHQNDCNHLDV
ncbi:hypothetical protein CDAR_435841 [Caerostris darwini]|uniref:Uncharacterized protein n=1 Tax=Caerostris darwini TaxID=1538125 RepID=A0AAV4PLS2_9ARAC|nr:hypothetical protein CDAR_435841 [Caerostris darwini]